MAAQVDTASGRIGSSFGRYEVLSWHRCGSTSDIFTAFHRDRHGGDLVVIKSLLPVLADDPTSLRAFLSEMRLHRDLDHPQIVLCLDVGTEEGLPYLVLEYVDGVTLRERIDGARPERIPVEATLEIAVRLCDALHYLHERRPQVRGTASCHGDVCPENVMIRTDGGIKLIDFGLATSDPVVQCEPPDVSEIALRICRNSGRLQYCAPERLTGASADRLTDVYSVGALLFELLHGVPPFAGDTPFDLSDRIRAGETVAPDPAADPELTEIVARAMALAPSERTSSALVLQRELSVVRERLQAHSAVRRAAVPKDASLVEDVTLRLTEGSSLASEIRRLIRETRSPHERPISASRTGPHTPASARREAHEIAALWFDRGWTALRRGRLAEARTAWETACLLEPDNRAYEVDLEGLEEKLSRR